MSSRMVPVWLARRPMTAWLVVALVVSLTSLGVAGGIGNFRNNAVGGVSINPEGVLSQADPDARRMVLREMRTLFQPASGELKLPTEMRMVSLRGLEAACEEALRTNQGQLPDEVSYLAGMTRIQYVLVYPEQNDIVLAGPGEGWRVDEQANVVGITTGRPVLQLDDLLVALRTVRAAREVGISCSIDPTDEGYRQLNALLSRERKKVGQRNLAALEAAMKQAFGPQQITVTGVPASSHFARVMVAADYRMKRIAMKLDPSPVGGLPSFVDMIRTSRPSSDVNPRWWLACNYDPLARTDDGLAWELRGPGVKVMTEDEALTQEGQVKATGKSNHVAQRWSDLMTEKYDELSREDAVFGQLRNIMDMCVVAALIEKQDLLNRAGCSLPLLAGAESGLALERWNAPHTVEPQCSFLKTRSGYIVTASGGVLIDSWQIASRSDVSNELQPVREKAAPAGATAFWWH